MPPIHTINTNFKQIRTLITFNTVNNIKINCRLKEIDTSSITIFADNVKDFNAIITFLKNCSLGYRCVGVPEIMISKSAQCRKLTV